MRAAADRLLTRALLRLQRVKGLPDWAWLLARLALLLRSPEFDAARKAVRKVAVDPSFTNKRGPHAFTHMQQEAGVYHPLGENLVREVEARMWTRVYAQETNTVIPWQRAGALSELAYLALKERGR